MNELRDRSFKDFDVPVAHLSRHADYVPPKARDEVEIARRRALPEGTLLAEYQAQGTDITARMLVFLADHDESQFAPNLLAGSAINTFWYIRGKHAKKVMRRRLKMPVHAERKGLVTRDTLMADAQEGFTEAAFLADMVRLSIERRSSAIMSFKKKFALKIGNSALILACVPEAGLIGTSLDPVEAQAHTRHAAMVAFQASRSLEEEIGANPTMAQLADPDSPLSVYIRRKGTNATVEALEFATSSEMSAQS